MSKIWVSLSLKSGPKPPIFDVILRLQLNVDFNCEYLRNETRRRQTEEQWRREGAKGGIRPADTEETDSDILHPLIRPNIPTVLGPYLNCQCSTTPTKQCVHQETYTADPTDHSSAVKLYRRSILSSYCFTRNRNSMFCTIYMFPNSA